MSAEHNVYIAMFKSCYPCVLTFTGIQMQIIVLLIFLVTASQHYSHVHVNKTPVRALINLNIQRQLVNVNIVFSVKLLLGKDNTVEFRSFMNLCFVLRSTWYKYSVECWNCFCVVVSSNVCQCP